MTITEQQVINIMQAVHDMRDAQEKYYGHQTEYHLKVSKAKEQVVDNIIKYFLKEGLVKPVVPPPAAPKLF